MNAWDKIEAIKELDAVNPDDFLKLLEDAEFESFFVTGLHPKCWLDVAGGLYKNDPPKLERMMVRIRAHLPS